MLMLMSVKEGGIDAYSRRKEQGRYLYSKRSNSHPEPTAIH